MPQQPTVLIVDDNIEVAELTCEIVELAAVKAVYRTNVIDAIEYLARNVEQTVALLTDIDLGSPMSGIELAIYVAQEWPSLPICVISGIAGARPQRLPPAAGFLRKPWRSAEVLAFVDEAIKG